MKVTELPLELLTHSLFLLPTTCLATCDRVSRTFQYVVECVLRQRWSNASLSKQRLWFREGTRKTLANVACGTFHSLFLNEEGHVLSAGGKNNAFMSEALGLGDVDRAVRPQKLNTPGKICSITAGMSHSTLLGTKGEVFTCGQMLKTGHAQTLSIPTHLKALSHVYICCVSSGAHHNLAVTDEGVVLSWGTECIALGHEDVGLDNCHEPRRVEALDQQRTCQVAAGGRHSLALSTDGTLSSWGSGQMGQLGYGGMIDGYGDFRSGKIPHAIEGLPCVRSVAAGKSFSAAITIYNSLYTWGSGGDGQLGYQAASRAPTYMRCMSRPTQVDSLRNVRSVSLGDNHALAVTEEGNLYTWGLNFQGQLGRRVCSSTNPSADYRPIQVEGFGPGLNPICSVAAGAVHSIVVTRDGRAFGFGFGIDATLGLPLTENQKVPKQYNDLTIHVIN